MADPLPPNPFPFLTPSCAGGRNSICRADTPYPSVSSESVPSLINNLTYALYGQVQKNVTNGQVTWTIPCDPNNTATINGIPRVAGEGLLCYVIRSLNLTIPSNGFVTVNGVQTLTNKTLTAPVINTATINNLTATGTLALPVGSVTSSMIADGTIVNADINASAAIATSKLAPVTSTGSTTARTLENRFADVVNVKDFGAVGDGVTDDTAAIQAALNAATDGGTVYAPAGKYYCATSITIPRHVTFKGCTQSIGSERYAYFDIPAYNNAIYLSNTATISLSNGSTVCDFLIVNKNLVAAYPFANQTVAKNAVNAYAGTAISGSSKEDIYLHNLRIMGFAQAIYGTLCDRAKIDWIDIDCTAGVWLDQTYDISRVHNVHCWGFATYGVSTNTNNVHYRSGAAFKLTVHFDGGIIADSFSYGYNIGFDIQAFAVNLARCWVEGGGSSYTVGQIGYKISDIAMQVNLWECSVDTCDSGIQINTTNNSQVGIQNCQIFANYKGIELIHGFEVSIDSCNFYYPQSDAHEGVPVAFPNGFALIHVNQYNGYVSISNNYFFGSTTICPAIYLTNYAQFITITGNKITFSPIGIYVDSATSAQAVITGNNFSGSTLGYSYASSAFINKLTQHSNLSVTGDTLGNVISNLGGQPASVDNAFGGGNGARHYSNYSRGTSASPTTVLSGDVLGSYRFSGYDGANLVQSAIIRAQVAGTPSTGVVSSGMIFTTSTGGTQADRLYMADTGHFYPLTDNAYTCGTAGARWSQIWAANATIQTSDERTKKEITNSPLGLDFIKALRPVSYKFKVGSNKVIRQVYRDAEGNEVDANAEGANPAEIITEEIAGERVHFGLLAQQVKEVLPAGVDFGGWILTDKNDPDSEQGLRYEEFISPLIKAIQELSERVKALESR